MTLDVTIGQQTPLQISMGAIVDPSAIWPEPGNASLGDFLFNTFSQSLRNQIVLSATPRRIELRATAGIPAFVSVGGRWAVASSTIFVDNAVAGQRYLLADLSADDGTFVLVAAASATPAAWQKYLGDFYDTGVALIALDTGALGLATTATGVLALGGAGAALRLNDRLLAATWNDLYTDNSGWFKGANTAGTVMFQAAANIFTAFGALYASGAQADIAFDDTAVNGRLTHLFRASDVTTFSDSVNGTIAALSNTGGLTLAPTATGTTGLTVTQKANGTNNVARFSAAATANGQVVDVDKNGHLALSQAAVPTGVLGTGAGNGAGTAPVLTITGTDQAGIIQIVTGTQVPVAGAVIVSVSFKTAMAVAPWTVQVQFANGVAQLLARNQDPVAVSLTTSGWVLFANAAALAISSTYQWSYQVK